MSLAPLELTLSFVHLSIKTLCVLKKKLILSTILDLYFLAAMKFIFMAKFLQRVYNLDKYSKLENDMAPGTEGGGGGEGWLCHEKIYLIMAVNYLQSRPLFSFGDDWSPSPFPLKNCIIPPPPVINNDIVPDKLGIWKKNPRTEIDDFAH